jgi:hypothetical protein
VNVDQATLDRAAGNCHAMHLELNRMRQVATRAGVVNVAEQLDAVRARAWYTMRELIEAGASDPTGRLAAIAPNVPLQLLDSPANRRLLNALLEAHEAALEVDRERGIEDGFADVIEHFAAGVQTEVHGPADARQGEGRCR